MIRVLIADDQELIRESLKIVLGIHEDISVVGVAKDGYEVLQMLERQQVDVILMDIRMPGMDGVYCTKEVKNRYPKTRIIILTTFDDDEFVFGALKYGASGYLLKGVSMDELYNDIITVYQGGALINPDIANKVFSMFTRMNTQNLYIQVDEADAAQVSEAEWKVVRLVGYGLSNREIAQKLFLSEGTVRNQLSSVLSKLNLRDRTQLAIWAVQTGKTLKDFDEHA